MASRKIISLIFVFAAATGVQAGPQDWPAYAHTMSRQSIAVDGPNTIDSNTLKWDAYIDPQDPNYYVAFEDTAQPIIYNGKVYAYAGVGEWDEELGVRIKTHSQIIAYDANSGQVLWWTVIDKGELSSWSTPCIDEKHNTVLIGSGNKVFALDAQSGVQKWSTPLDQNVVNASVCVATDIPHARAFITDYAPFDETGKLYCINLDESGPGNPYQPGQIVWSQALGYTCGNTPAYRNGVIYVATLGENYQGTIRAYDATLSYPMQLWGFINPDYEGFCGGVVVTKGGFLYAVTYNFYPEVSEDNSTLFKINCTNGSVIWTTKIQATDCVPIVVGDKIYISGGYGYPKIEAYYDYGDTATKLWETDSDLSVGGWDNQPVYADGKLYIAGTSWEYLHPMYDEFYILNVTLTPNDPNFVAAYYNYWWCGDSRAVTYDSVYAIGYDGLFKFHQPALLGDISDDNVVDMSDLVEFVDDWLYNGPVGGSRADLDLDGDVDFTDFSLLANEWRKELSGE
ncbi:MAG: PQQ-binding-like beta-propeller repeat protein [Phycisphaerae bacterium]|nr:PQQ-binding-like beta-propeller repeat protein [Phycisphaerae bacterium]MDD5380752.1 PQQ-binding-like beta-propeller repeat protein [Phycisphaerae bacterium]